MKTKKTKTKNVQKPYDIRYNQKYLFLNCPKCHKIPYLSFNEEIPQNINIKCDKCQKYSNQPLIIPLNNYLKTMKNIDLLKDKNKCFIHNTLLDKFCYKCHIQFCTKCEKNKKHLSHKTKIIEKIITKEKIEKGKKTLEYYKDYFKKYIFKFMDEYINKFPKSKQYDIKSFLMKQYINDMSQFFHFCDCVLLNYDIDYPNYYQQMNLHYFLKFLFEKVELNNLNEKKIERIFKYSNNNFINKKMNEEDNLIKCDELDFSDNHIYNAILINKEFILIESKDGIKLYNYKNKKYISTLDIKENSLEHYFHIYNDIVVIYRSKKIQIFSLFENNYKGMLLLEQEVDININKIKRINNNSLGFMTDKKIEVYKSSDNFEDIPNLLKNNKSYTIKLDKITSIEFSEEIYDFIQTSDKEYIICLFVTNCIIYKSKDFSVFKKMKIDQMEEEEYNFDNKPKIVYCKEEGKYKEIIHFNNGNYILGGRNIGIINSNDWSFKVLLDENIKRVSQGYYSGTKTKLIYSGFILTYSNKLICKRYLNEQYGCTFEVDIESKTEDGLCIFDFNPEKNTLNQVSYDESWSFIKMFINSNDEIIVVDWKNIVIYYID